MKKAFTLSEMLICLAIISVITMVIMSVTRVKPNVNMVMLRKAYYTTSNTVYEMLQSASYYTSGVLSDQSPATVAIDGQSGVAGDVKFCKIFASFLNTGGDVNCSANGTPSFTTLDGISWYIPMETFKDSSTITVDINGENEKPNCKEGDEGCNAPDTFEFIIYNTGKISVNGDIAKEYLQNSRKITK